MSIFELPENYTTMKTAVKYAMRGLLPLLTVLTVLSCTEKDGPYLLYEGQGETDLSAIRVNASPPPLYANLPDDPERSDTKGLPETVSLGSVLDIRRQRKTAFRGVPIRQIPFSAEYSGMTAYFGASPGGGPEEAVVMKRFLILGADEAFVVSMVTGHGYARLHPAFD